VVPPAIQGLGVSGGFQMMLQLKGAGFDFAKIGRMTEELVDDGNTQSGLLGLNTSFRPGYPQIDTAVDRVAAENVNVPVGSVFNALQSYLGSYYVNQFNKFGRTYQVYVQADSRYRLEPDDIRRLYVRNTKNQMVPLGTMTEVNISSAPAVITLYNLYPAAPINGMAAPGYSSGQALKIMEDMAVQKLSSDMGFEWTGMSFQEKLVGNQAIFVFAIASLMVFLVLAAQYESWTAPAAVILVVPLAMLGTVLALIARHFDNNVYTQIGLVLLIALAAKNAILIVEHGRELLAGGMPLMEAAVEASRRRLRPILMTSFAFILGVLPLAVAKGAGAASRQALGTAVIGGMLASTLIAILFVPVFFVLMVKLSRWRERKNNKSG
jgi:HAE1 family hydrophobic/amphiphilic exporter-1